LGDDLSSEGATAGGVRVQKPRRKLRVIAVEEAEEVFGKE